MPIRYELDDVLRRVVVTVDGLFETDDILTIMARQRAEHTWSYGILYDLRGMIGTPTAGELRQLMGEADAPTPGEEPRGSVALLVTDQALYARLSTYAALGRSPTRTIAVFRDRGATERWLTAQTGK
jgi:hypothetical protein